MKPLPKGAVMGHEFAGEIVALGKQAAGRFRLGERVAVLPYIGCGACQACLAGRGHRCAGAQWAGLGSLPGAYAEYARIGAAEAVRLPDSVDDDQGALVEPLAVGLHAVRAGHLRPGDSALVIGAGPVGLAVALWLKEFGARHVIVSDLSPDRRALAERIGTTAVIDPRAEPVPEAAKRLAGGRPALVFDCVGVPGSQQLAMDYAPTDGRVVVVGVCMQPDRVLPTKAVTKELTVAYVFMYERRDFELAVDLMARRRMNPLPMLTGHVGFGTFSTAFEALKRDKTHGKVMLKPDLAGDTWPIPTF
jgi:(R,R)-butanediol dehydrogenase/meso-butanediol dehydrogenase/diacetyl reductase